MITNARESPAKPERSFLRPLNCDARYGLTLLAALGFLGLLAGGLLWVGIFPAGPKLPGTDTPIFDPGLVTTMAAGITEISNQYAGK